MKKTNNDKFVEESPLYPISCPENTWDDHIIAGHSMMKDNLDAVKDTIKSPYQIYQSLSDPKRDVFFGKSSVATYGEKFYTKVVVEQPKDSQSKGYVVTAFPSKEIKGNIDTGVMKYDAGTSGSKK